MNILGPDRWRQLWTATGVLQVPYPWLDRLTAAYCEPHRHYHTLQHVAECLREFDAARHLAHDPAAVELGLWFHDAVYDPRASDNEEQSAALARLCFAEFNVDASLIERVSRLVLSTRHHDTGMDRDAPLLVDIDLSILGQPEKRFLEYESQIRQEYAWVPENVFLEKRAEILQGFLARPRLYATDWFYEKLEKQARTNLMRSCARPAN